MGSLFSGFLTAASLKSGGSFDVLVLISPYNVGPTTCKLERTQRGNRTKWTPCSSLFQRNRNNLEPD